MRELVGTCNTCGEPVYCENGFFDGVHESGKILCNQCAENLNNLASDVD